MEKRFLLFAGQNYYPDGGWHDFVKSFDTYEEADRYLRQEIIGQSQYGPIYRYVDQWPQPYPYAYDWYHIHDLGGTPQ